MSSQESAEVRKLRAEVKELRRANEILKAASAFFAAELDRPTSRS
jgi:transposase